MSLPNAHDLAVAFSTILRGWLSPAEMATVNVKNQKLAPGVCASHDVCDPNVAMLEALEALAGEVVDTREPWVNALWSAAWSEAKAALFFVEPALIPFSTMTADQIVQHRLLWKLGRAEIWRGSTARQSNVDPARTVPSDHEAPTAGICAQQMGSAMTGQIGAVVTSQPQLVTFVGPT